MSDKKRKRRTEEDDRPSKKRLPETGRASQTVKFSAVSDTADWAPAIGKPLVHPCINYCLFTKQVESPETTANKNCSYHAWTRSLHELSLSCLQEASRKDHASWYINICREVRCFRERALVVLLRPSQARLHRKGRAGRRTRRPHQALCGRLRSDYGTAAGSAGTESRGSRDFACHRSRSRGRVSRG